MDNGDKTRLGLEVFILRRSGFHRVWLPAVGAPRPSLAALLPCVHSIVLEPDTLSLLEAAPLPDAPHTG